MYKRQKLSQAEIDRFAKDDLAPLVSGPVTIKTTDPKASGADKTISFELTAEQLAAVVSIKNSQGKLSATVDEDKIQQTAVAAGKASGRFRPAQDATVQRNGRSFSVTPSSSGLELKAEGLGADIAAAMKKSGSERAVTARAQEAKPEFTTAEAKRTLPKEQISTCLLYTSPSPRD